MTPGCTNGSRPVMETIQRSHGDSYEPAASGRGAAPRCRPWCLTCLRDGPEPLLGELELRLCNGTSRARTAISAACSALSLAS